MDQRIHDAIQIVEKRQGSADPIPAEILQNAKGVAICTIVKGGIGIGGPGRGRHRDDPPSRRRGPRLAGSLCV